MSETSETSETSEMPAEITDEEILADLDAYKNGGLIDYVLPTVPLGEQWIVGWNGRILKFVTKEGIVGFLTGIQVCAMFAAKQREDPLSRLLGAQG